MMPTAHDCPFTDCVLAQHLDGDVADSPLGAGALAEHLLECEVCQRQLQRGRRLDAALAETSGRAVAVLGLAPQRIEAWLDAAAAQAAANPPADSRRFRIRPPRATRLLALGSTLILLGGLTWSPDPSRTPPLAAGTMPATVAHSVPALRIDQPPEPPAPEAPPRLAAWDPIPLPGAVGPPARRADPFSRPPRSEPVVAGLSAILTRRHLSAHILAWELSGCLGWGLPGPDGAATAQALQRQAALLLLASGRLDAETAVLRWLAAGDGSAAVDEVLGEVRGRGAIQARLARRILQERPHARSEASDFGETADVVVAARLGGRVLEDALLCAVRQRPGLVEVISAALRAPVDRPGRASLLLDLWAEEAQHGAFRGEEATAFRLFGQQPTGVVPELAAELRKGRHADRRHRCLLALGALGNPAARPILERCLWGSVHPESIAAAWALAQLPRDELRDLTRRAMHPKAHLLRTALLVAGVPALTEWIAASDLSPADQRGVLVARTSVTDFARAAELLRLRAIAPP